MVLISLLSRFTGFSHFFFFFLVNQLSVPIETTIGAKSGSESKIEFVKLLIINTSC